MIEKLILATNIEHTLEKLENKINEIVDFVNNNLYIPNNIINQFGDNKIKFIKDIAGVSTSGEDNTGDTTKNGFNINPCPICSEKMKLIKLYGPTYFLKCSGCDLSTKIFQSRHELLDYWNIID